MKEFLQRLGILFHVFGYLNTIATIFISLAIDELFFILIAPSGIVMGWALRWLFTGEVVNLIPFYDKHKLAILSIPRVIKSVHNPVEYFYSVFGFLLVGVFIINFDVLPRDKTRWEQRVFDTTCTYSDGTPKELGRFSGTNKPYYCSDYPELCTWGDNSESYICKRYSEYDPPDPIATFVEEYLMVPAVYIIIFLPIVFLHFLVRMIIYIRQ